MSDADTRHPLSRQVFAWSFAIGAVTLTLGVAVGLVGLIVAACRKEMGSRCQS